MAPTNAELIHAVNNVLAASRHFRQLYGRASPSQRAAIMADFPWPRRTLELREMTAWVASVSTALQGADPPAAGTARLSVEGKLAG